MLEERIRTHIEEIAAPVSIDDVHELVAGDASMQLSLIHISEPTRPY